MAFSQSHFQNAQNFQIYDGQFSNNALLVNPTFNPPSHDSVSTFLLPHVVVGATFDSNERYADGKCHEGTRQEMIETIMDWATDTDTTDYILWLYGPAGAGKSALAQTICELLHRDHPEVYGGSFFFAHGPTDRGSASKLFTTLSYQLAIHFSSIRSEVNSALSRDPSLPTKSMKIQFNNLIAQPLKRCRGLLSHNPVLVIDGLDECADDEGKDVQHNIVALIAEMIVVQKLPLRVLIASRPESCIRKAFDNEPLSAITQDLCLQDDEDAERDIEAYLIAGFEKIYQENKRIMGSVETPWPSRKIIRHLVKEASGQYIYASTVLRFVGKSSKFVIPQNQLEIITSPGPYRALAFSSLDKMYTRILSTYPRWEMMKRVLEGLLVRANTTLIKAILGVDPEELDLVQDALGSLIDVFKPKQPPDDYLFLASIFGPLLDGRDKIVFCHKSFQEFLKDSTRSGEFHVDPDAARNDIVQGFFDLIHCNLDQNYEIEPHLFVNIDHFTYHSIMVTITSDCLYDWVLHGSLDTLSSLLLRMTERLVAVEFDGKSLDFLLYFMRDIERLKEILDSDKLDPLAHLLEVRKFRHKTESTILDDFGTAFAKLLNVVDQAQSKAMDALLLCRTFKVTPTLVYLAEFKRTGRLSIHELSTIPGTTDVVSTIKYHRHFLRVSGRFSTDTVSLKLMNLSVIRRHEGLHTQDEWNDERIWIAEHCLKLILNPQTVLGRRKFPGGQPDAITFLQTFFSDSRQTSDICTHEYFQNPYNISILALMTDLAAWTRLLKKRWMGNGFILLIVRWFNRQLANPQTLKLLQNHDESLQQTMTTATRLILDHRVIPVLAAFSRPRLCADATFASTGGDPRSITLNILPLPQGFHQQEKDDYSDDDPNFKHWRPLHNEVFGEPLGSKTKDSKDPLIDPSCWHPHLASLLLDALIRFLYGRAYPDFSTEGYNYEESFPYFTQSLPYAETTPETLDALRAIVYLYPQSTPAWDPPEGFWLLLVELLKKYDHSVLSSEEMDLFMSWLKSTDHADIGTYAKE